ncbi:UNVERIFIED_ORG: hypothetical protein J2Y81_006121 [Paraburkholderia sediminicola]|nr:hypothetical protein [Paraburkholderia sediminicola]
MISKTVEQFYSDISDISMRLVRAYGLAHRAPDDQPDLALERWMDYRLRHINPQPREVQKSNRFPIGGLPSDVREALCLIEARFSNGDEVNPYLSKGILNNDVANLKQQNRTDGLWADWGIHHFHLTTEPLAVGQRFSKRSGWLLFAKVYDDAVAFIDVRDHNEDFLWTQADLLKTFISSWPEQAEPFRISTMKVEPREQTPETLQTLRSAGVFVPIEHEGNFYFGPGGGVTTSATSTKVSVACMSVRTDARRIATWLEMPDNVLRAELRSRGVEDPQFAIGCNDVGLILGEMTAPDCYWQLARSGGEDASNPMQALHDLFLPEWAAVALITDLESKQSA